MGVSTTIWGQKYFLEEAQLLAQGVIMRAEEFIAGLNMYDPLTIYGQTWDGVKQLSQGYVIEMDKGFRANIQDSEVVAVWTVHGECCILLADAPIAGYITERQYKYFAKALRSCVQKLKDKTLPRKKR